MPLGEQGADPSAFAVARRGMCQGPFLFAIILTCLCWHPTVMLISKQIKLHVGSTLCESPLPHTPHSWASIHPANHIIFHIWSFSGNYDNYWKFSTSWKLEACIPMWCAVEMWAESPQIGGNHGQGRGKRLLLPVSQ